MLQKHNEFKKNAILQQYNQNQSSKVGLKSCKENKIANWNKRNPLKSIKLVVQRPPTNISPHLISETNTVKANYLGSMIASELAKAAKSNRSSFLSKHRISPEVRARMVN